jgi:hypothetical protein
MTPMMMRFTLLAVALAALSMQMKARAGGSEIEGFAQAAPLGHHVNHAAPRP